jgi:hypothetical protein
MLKSEASSKSHHKRQSLQWETLRLRGSGPCVRVLAERREGPDYGDVAVTDDLDFGVITENYGRCGFRTVTEMHNQAPPPRGLNCARPNPNAVFFFFCAPPKGARVLVG